MRRLERFAVDVIKYGNKELAEGEAEAKALELVLSLSRADKLVEFDYNPEILDIVNQASEKSLKSLVGQFKKLAAKTNNSKLAKDAAVADKRIKELEQARHQAEEEAERLRKKAEKFEAKAKEETKRSEDIESQNVFLQDLVSADTELLVGIHHHIRIAAQTIQNNISATVKKIRKGAPVSVESFVEILERISMQASQVRSATRFATKAQFDLEASKITYDLVEFVREYVTNVCRNFVRTESGGKMKFVGEGADFLFEKEFRPFEVTVLVDNLINNAKKAGADCFSIYFKEEKSAVIFEFLDNGKGISKKNSDKIFELGFTTTHSGSGFGLFHSSKIADQLGGTLELDKNNDKGAKFILKIPK